MLKTVRMQRTVEADGNIRLEIPAGKAGDQVEVVVVLSEPLAQRDRERWREFVREMAGSCPDLEEPEDIPPAPLTESL